MDFPANYTSYFVTVSVYAVPVPHCVVIDVVVVVVVVVVSGAPLYSK